MISSAVRARGQPCWQEVEAAAGACLHCCVMSENILLTDKHDVTSVMLTDFGISRCGDLPNMQLDGFGTPAYMAPELFGAEPVYSAAVRLRVVAWPDLACVGVAHWRLGCRRTCGLWASFCSCYCPGGTRSPRAALAPAAGAQRNV